MLEIDKQTMITAFKVVGASNDYGSLYDAIREGMMIAYNLGYDSGYVTELESSEIDQKLRDMEIASERSED